VSGCRPGPRDVVAEERPTGAQRSGDVLERSTRVCSHRPVRQPERFDGYVPRDVLENETVELFVEWGLVVAR